MDAELLTFTLPWGPRHWEAGSFSVSAKTPSIIWPRSYHSLPVHPFPTAPTIHLGFLGWEWLCEMLYCDLGDCLTPSLALAWKMKIKPQVQSPVGHSALPRLGGCHLSIRDCLFLQREPGFLCSLLKVHIDLQPPWSRAKWSLVRALGLFSPPGWNSFPL